MNLPSLGYSLKGPAATVCAQCHGAESLRTFEWTHNKHVVQESKDCLSCHTFTRAGALAGSFIKAKTELADQVSRASARINGLVNPGGKATTVYFQWGTGTGYGKATPALPIGSGTSEVPVSAVITGLTPGTTYHFRVVAQDGTTFSGYDYSFTTPRQFDTNLPFIIQVAWKQLKSLVGWA
jgi:hypothetical protein